MNEQGMKSDAEMDMERVDERQAPRPEMREEDPPQKHAESAEESNYREEGDEREQFSDSEGESMESPQESRNEAPPPPRPAQPRGSREEEYAAQILFDRAANLFVGTCVEFPEVVVKGVRKDDVLQEILERIADELEVYRSRNEPVPPALMNRNYPEKLEIRLSRSLQRRLDSLSRQERVPVDQVVTELLTRALSQGPLRKEGPRQEGRHGEQRHKQGPPNGNSHHHGKGRDGRQQHRGNNRGGGGGGGNNRNYHDTMGNRENFLEYVRNLEKGGGFTKKR